MSRNSVRKYFPLLLYTKKRTFELPYASLFKNIKRHWLIMLLKFLL